MALDALLAFRGSSCVYVGFAAVGGGGRCCKLRVLGDTMVMQVGARGVHCYILGVFLSDVFGKPAKSRGWRSPTSDVVSSDIACCACFVDDLGGGMRSPVSHASMFLCAAEDPDDA